jgi:hypothetical protein
MMIFLKQIFYSNEMMYPSSIVQLQLRFWPVDVPIVEVLYGGGVVEALVVELVTVCISSTGNILI